MCKTNDLYGQSTWVNGSKIYVDSFGAVDATDLDALMSEIYTNGPIACYMYAHSASFEEYTGVSRINNSCEDEYLLTLCFVPGGIITDATQYDGITHVVALVGWGTEAETGLDYWAVRNSFGTYWGEQGFYRVQRGINAFNMETGVCEWATPTAESVEALIQSAALPIG
jgi:hypothetical protein